MTDARDAAIRNAEKALFEGWDVTATIEGVWDAAIEAVRERCAAWCDERARKFLRAMDETKDRPPRMMYVSCGYADLGHEFEFAAKMLRALDLSAAVVPQPAPDACGKRIEDATEGE